MKKYILSLLLLTSSWATIQPDPATDASNMLAAVAINKATNTTQTLACTFTNLYNQVALEGTPLAFIDSISYQTALALSVAYYYANSSTWIAGNLSDTFAYLTAFAQNIATASASSQTGRDNAVDLTKYPNRGSSLVDYTGNIYDAIQLTSIDSFINFFAQAALNSFNSHLTPSVIAAAALANALRYILTVLPTYAVPFTSASMFTAAYAAAYAKSIHIAYSIQATHYSNAGKYSASPASNAASFASSFAQKAATALTAVANYTGTAPANYKQAAYAAAYAELYLSAIAKATGEAQIPFISYSDVNAAIAAGIIASSSSTATTVLDATKDAVASASQIMATNLGYNYVDVSQIGLFALEAAAYSNPQQFLANLRALGLTPATLVSYANFFVTKTNFEKKGDTIARTNDQALAWVFSQAAILEQQATNNTLTINGSLQIAGNTLTINVAALTDISIPSGGAVTFTTPMTIVLNVNSVPTPISNVTGLTVVNSGTNNSLAVTGSLTINAVATGNYVNILDFGVSTLTISDTFICNGASLGSINNFGVITVTNDITMSNGNSSGVTALHNIGSIISTAGTITMNNNTATIDGSGNGIVTTGTIQSHGTITMNSNEGNAGGGGVELSGTIQTGGTFNFTATSTPPVGTLQSLYALSAVTNLSSADLSFSQFQFTIDGTLFTGNYTALGIAYPGLITLDAGNQ